MSSPKEILREYVIHLEGMSESIKARVMRDLAPDPQLGVFSWDISHFSREGGSAHRHAQTAEEATALMMEYINTLNAENIYAKNFRY